MRSPLNSLRDYIKKQLKNDITLIDERNTSKICFLCGNVLKSAILKKGFNSNGTPKLVCLNFF